MTNDRLDDGALPDLSTSYLGLHLRTPLVASAGPYTGDLDRVVELETAGASAVVLPSLFEEQIEHDTAEIDRLYALGADSFGEATGLLPELDTYNTGPDTYLDLIDRVKQRVGVPVIASLNGSNLGGWVRYARLVEEAGADALELNLYAVAADPTRRASEIEAEQLELVRTVVEHCHIPVAVKLAPFYSALTNFLVELQSTGAAGVVMFNRFYAPDLDLDTLDVRPALTLSSPDDLLLPLRWIGIAREYLAISIAASSGIHDGLGAVKALLAGADVAMTTSSVLRHGTGHLATIERELTDWMAEHGYRSVEELRGAACQGAVADPDAYERAHYIGNLTRFASRFVFTG